MSETATQALLSLCEDRRRWKAELTADAVRKLLAEGADVHGRGRYGSTPLHSAVLAPNAKSDPRPDLEVVRALLGAGADPNARDAHARTPLLRAVPLNKDDSYEAHALELIHLLRAAGARVPDDVTDWNAGAFCDGGSPRIYKEVLDAGARVDVRGYGGTTPLHRAAGYGYAPMAELLLARGADVNAMDGLGRTPLGMALREITKPWVKANDRLAGFNAVIALLKGAGGLPRVTYAPSETDPFAPFPIDSAALLAASPKGEFPFEHEVDSAQEFVTGIRADGEPKRALALVAALRDTVGVPPRHLRLARPLELRQPFFHHGDLEVDGSFTIRKPFAVTGNLIVHGILRDSDNDSKINILGDVRCHSLYTDGEINIRGNLHARDVVYTYYNDHVLAADTVHARVVIEDDHGVDATVKAEHHFDLGTYNQGYGEGVGERIKALFIDEVLQPEEEEEPRKLDRGELFDRLEKGLPVFREKA
ncbi:ankyrin repeat domain-containing protein [Pyxidicoccus parkwayensis]|uniref:Ankyrin repeat domain-containing protein n=1 Tax=Pyxidicoccus parkwayensis TaxID=2813578 RepID=A0ABX7NUI0_9BACT|nr:ankyrin repeat domain-containing protein [Pyxidicoccus parkwaysis]QSQ22445.1 ankyrin repeat domain-containing protein [Pyxidicoccus parkwaysis]